MRLIVILLITAFMQIAFAGNAQKISIHQKNVSLKVIFQQIRLQSGYDFFYDKDLMEHAKHVSIDVQEASLEAVLQQCLIDQPFTYTIEEKTVIIKTKKIPLLHKVTALFSTIDIRGKVVNEKNEPLIGATVKVISEDPVESITGSGEVLPVFSKDAKRSVKSATTNENGDFYILGIDRNAKLQISYIGYEPMEVVAKPDLGVVQLKLSVSKLDEVQVIAYGTTTQRLNVGSVTTINTEDIKRQPVGNVLQAMQSNVSGLEISQVSGIAGSGFRVHIRGVNSLNSGSNPLFIVDGVEVSGIDPYSNGVDPFNSINPNDIESVSVLKDADATAIYGSKGANGVILVTTKKGKPGTSKFDVALYTGINHYTKAANLLNTEQYLEVRREAFKNDGQIPTAFNAPDLTGYGISSNINQYTDWTKAIIGQAAYTTDLQLSLSGGNLQTTYLISSAFHRETPPLPGDFSSSRPSVHFNIGHHSKDQKLNISLNGNYSFINNNFPQSDVSSSILSLPPNLPSQVNADGSFNFFSPRITNPYALLAQSSATQIKTLIANALVSYQLTKGLALKSTFGYSDINKSSTVLIPLNTVNPAYRITSGQNFSVFNTINSWQIAPQLEYKQDIGKGNLTVLLGGNYEGNTNSGHSISARNFANQNLLEDFSTASSITVFPNYAHYKYLAMFARINYNLKDRYLLNFTANRDGSSRFGPGRRFGNFGSVGTGWIFSKEENIQKALPWLSFGKLRMSYGITGNDQIGDYQYLDTYSNASAVSPFNILMSGLTYNGQGTLVPTSLYNADYSWETTHKLETGIDLGLFKDRILLYAGWYRNRSSSQLINYSLPPTTGFGGILENLPATIGNKGWEFTVNTINIQNQRFIWKSAFNITIPKNQLLSFPDLANSSYNNTYVIGQPLSIQKVYTYIGVDPQTGVYKFADANGNPTFNPTPVIDQQMLVNTDKILYGGFSNTFQYHSFQISVDLQFVKQTGLNTSYGYLPAGSLYNFNATVLSSHWQNPGDIADIQKFTQNPSSAAYAASIYVASSEKRYTDASFIRVKNVALSYTVNSKFLQRMRINDLRLNISSQNLFTLTKFKGNDPEYTNLGTLPPLRSIVAGLQCSL